MLFAVSNLLNLVLCSLLTLKSVVIPTLLWILPDQCNQMRGHHLCDHKAAIAIYSFLRSGLVEIFYVSSIFYVVVFLKSLLVMLLVLAFKLMLKVQVYSDSLSN